MERLTDHRIVLVTRRTRLEDLIRKFNTRAQARFYVEHLGADFDDYELEHQCYSTQRDICLAVLARLGNVSEIERSFLPNFLFRPDDTIVVLGQDGTVANTLKYLSGQPCLGVNPDPVRWDGVLLPFQATELIEILPEVFAKRARLQAVTFAKATLNTGEALLGVNDLFIGPRSHTSARYQIRHEGKLETQSSSGIIVSTGLGSTGWLKSILQGATAIARAATSQTAPDPNTDLPWDHPQLVFTVREPFPSRSTQATLVYGTITERMPLSLVSTMASSGIIFSDGIEADFLNFNNGTQVTITVVPGAGSLVTR
jgi:NAD kinase